MEDGAGALFYCQLVTKTQVKQLKLFFLSIAMSSEDIRKAAFSSDEEGTI